MKRIRDFFGNLFGGRQQKRQQNAVKQQPVKGQKAPAKRQKEPLKGQKKTPQKIQKTENSKLPVPKKPLIVYDPRLTPQNGKPPNQQIFDVCAYVILCVKHNKIALSADQRSGFVWLPFVSLTNSGTWTEGSTDGANIILANGNTDLYLKIKNQQVMGSTQCMQIFRLQLPQTQKFNIRLIYCVKLNQNNPIFKCCTNTKTINWYDTNDVINGKVRNVWGPEVVEYTKLSVGKIEQKISEFSLDQAFFYVPRDPPRNLEEELLRSTNYTEKDVERIYGDFVEHCFPSFYMTRTSFREYMTKYGFEKNEPKLKRLFTAFNFKNSGFLSFPEFLIGLVSMEPLATNGQSRIKLVFKYYNINKNGFLSNKEFEEMVRDIHPKDSEQQIEKRVSGGMKRIGIKKEGVAFDDFFKACGSHKFRGTSSLCRSHRSIITQISRSLAERSLARSTLPTKVLNTGFKKLLEDIQYKGVCNSCKEKKYDYAIHTVSLNKEGYCVNPKILPEWDNIDHPERSITSTLSYLSGSQAESVLSDESVESLLEKSNRSSNSLLNMSFDRFDREYVFNPKFAANFFIEKIRAFNLIKGSHKDNKGVMDSLHERPQLVQQLEELCREVERLFSSEERCVRISSPTFVIGDIHGNLEDLMTMEKVLWRSIPVVAANYLFLGDYVDRGKWSVECAIYILCLKLLAPTKMFVLRGNHEVRDLQLHYTYKKECIKKYGDNYGQKVFEITNKVFDKLPVCAVVDDAIYCAHGGIPCNTRSIDKINEIKVNLKNPERESAIAWEILWSDPIGAQQFTETADLLQIRVETAKGFLPNTKRGTAYLFAEEAVNNFFNTNGLTHIIRAHEVPAHGYQFHFGTRCATVFSCSHYCGNDNEAACVHIDQQKLRIIRLDTVNNAPPSD